MKELNKEIEELLKDSDQTIKEIYDIVVKHDKKLDGTDSGSSQCF